MTNKVLVTGVGGPAGKATAEFLRQRGIIVIGTDIREVNTIVDDFHIVRGGNDPLFDSSILDLIAAERPSLVIPTVSEELPAFSRIKDKILDLGARVFISNVRTVDVANDKLMTAAELCSKGIAVPKTISASGASATIASQRLGYPCIVKPRIGRGGRGVALYEEEVEAARDQRTDVVWQEFMPGEECDLNLFAYPAGHVKTLVVLQKTRMKQGIIGNALTVQRVIRRDVAELGINVARTLDLEGPIDMDIRRDWAGIPNVLEINARVGANVLSASEVLESLLTTASEGN